MKSSKLYYLLIPVLAVLIALSLGGSILNVPEAAQANADNPGPDLREAYDLVVVKAFFTDEEALTRLLEWKEPWEVNRDEGYVVVDVQESEIPYLVSLGFTVEVDERLTELYNQPLTRLPGQVSGIPGYSCYRTVEETYATAEQIVADYPDLAEWVDIGDSWEKTNPGGNPGYDLMVLILTNKNTSGDKPVLFMMNSVHARELTPAELGTRYAEYLVENYNVDADITWLLDYHEVHLLLQANPDGRKQAETGLSWRKNTNENYCSPTSNSRGADLNRNFSFEWHGCSNESCSSSDPCNYNYRGPSAASEPETQAIEAYLESIFPDQRGELLTDAAPEDASGVFLDIHSYGQLVLWPWGFTNTDAPNGADLQTLGRKFAYFNAYEPQQAYDLYPTDGATDDYSYGTLGVAAFTFELGTTFFEACNVFENTILPENLPALVYAAKAAQAPYQLPAGPDALAVAASPAAVAIGEPISLTATIDDTRFNQSNGTEATQNISAAEYYLDVPPWDTDNSPAAVPMSAADGAFSAKTESVLAVIDTQGLSMGRHTVYVRGRDAGGNWGVVSAAFIYVIDPASAPVLQGTVLEGGSNLPLDASVRAGESFVTQTNPATGEYQMYVISGTYDLTAETSGYGSQTIHDIAIVNEQTQTANFSLYPYCTVFSDDVEGGNLGWTAEGTWAITTEDANSPSHAWTDSPDANYGNDQNLPLTSPVLDLSDYNGIQLDFWQLCDTEAGWDYCYVEVSADNGSSWTTLASYDGQTAWQQVTLDAPQLDNQPDARVRFRLESDSYFTEDGWYLDDIQVLGAGDACLAMLEPTASFTSSSPDTLGETTVFTNTSTGASLNYTWDFGDGSPGSNEIEPTHNYISGGGYTVTLMVTNTLGMDVYTGTIEIWDDILYFPVIRR